MGILHSYCKAWSEALEQGWEWCLVLEDDAACKLDGGWLQLLALLPVIVDSAKQQDGGWQLISLAPVDCDDFYQVCDPEHIPSLIGEAAPAWARRPKLVGPDTDWKKIGPTFHAFGWIFRAPLMQVASSRVAHARRSAQRTLKDPPPYSRRRFLMLGTRWSRL